ncbi:MAG: BatA domain-containing protein, partial [Gemmataceae bacterium]|nr:BatA domain-containing protein [Gemmataceae bacterium]
MFDLFANPGYFAAAAALVSVPIIIHLINRMRFKRIRWAAMEFLLKAQKRNRRRLIIEQLLLLALRCLLVALVGLLVMRFVGISFADFAAKTGLHVVLLDDSLSMTDQLRDANQPSCFDKAKKEVLDKVVKKLAAANTKERLLIVPLSKLATDPDFVPDSYEHFDKRYVDEIETSIKALEPTLLHVSLIQGVKKVQQIVDNNPESRPSVYLFSDFRHRDWSDKEGSALYEALRGLVDHHRELKLFLYDTALPERAAGQPLPLAHDNVGIADFRAGTRVAGKAMPVSFAATIINYSGRESEVHLRIEDEAGHEREDIDFHPPMPVRISPFSSLLVTFEMRFTPQLKANEPYFAQITARLKSRDLRDLDGDGLAADNVRYAAVEIREKVPILVIDGEGAKGRLENKDSFFLETAIMSVPGASYQVEYGDVLAGGQAEKALERSDLAKYPTIFLLNVPELNAKQQANLENFVKEGGGVAFFLGKQVSAKHYNTHLYKDGAGLFPAPLKETYYPPPN